MGDWWVAIDCRAIRGEYLLDMLCRSLPASHRARPAPPSVTPSTMRYYLANEYLAWYSRRYLDVQPRVYSRNS